MSVLVVSAHPDDAELLCGGTIASALAQGESVAVAILTDGSLGCPSKSSEEAAAIRRRESEKACDILGTKLVCFGLAGDGQLHDEEPVRLELAQIIGEIGPSAIITHSPRDYHTDHSACLDITRAACLLSYVTCTTGTKGKPSQPSPQLFLMDTVSSSTFEPHFYVDITSFWERKEAALNAHESQVELMASRGKDLVETARIQARLRGMQSRVKFAEGFQFYNAWLSARALLHLPLTNLSKKT